MDGDKKEIEHQLNVEEEWEYYLPLILRLREVLTARTLSISTSSDKMVKCAVLAPLGKKIEFIDIVLRTYDSKITLRLARHDLYLIGYQDGSGKWFEFQNPTVKRLIDGSEILPYDSNYMTLEAKAERARIATIYARPQLENAVNALAGKPRDEKIRARQLIIVIGMTSEAIRFDKIAIHLARLDPAEQRLTPWMKELHNSWSELCTQFFDDKNVKSYKFKEVTLQSYSEPATIRTLEEAVSVVRIVLEREIKAGVGASSTSTCANTD